MLVSHKSRQNKILLSNNGFMLPKFVPKHAGLRCRLFLKLTILMSILPAVCWATALRTSDLLQDLDSVDSSGKAILTSTKMVMFQQATNTTGGTDASSVSKITLSYFTSTDCTATNGTSVPTYTTPDGTSFAISVGAPFGMVAASAWNVGNSKVVPAVADMTLIQSIAVTFKSTNNNTPQTNFSGFSYACIPVACTAGECTSGSGTQSFSLKTTAAVGDPADGGVIGCQNTSSTFNLFDIVVSTSNSSLQAWGSTGTTTGATSTTNGATNTATIVAALGTVSTYAARTCTEYSAAGGFNSGWFLPSGNGTNTQLNCLYQNKAAINTGSVAAGGANFSDSLYWSSTEASATNAWRINFSNGTGASNPKTNSNSVRCTRAF